MSREKIYVFCPVNFKTGGTELLHQLADYLITNNYDANIVYVGDKEKNLQIKFFQEYKTKYIYESDIKSDFNGIVIIPEVYTYLLRKYVNAKKYLWWLSVDNYYSNYNFLKSINGIGINKTLKNRGKRFLSLFTHKYNKSISPRNLKKYVDINLVQSYYARDFLKGNGVDDSKIYDLFDYINQTYLEKMDVANAKKNIIVYNPKKGYKFTKSIIKRDTKHKYVPLINMTNNEIKKTLDTAKVYIDFGYHPGKDRFPREAAMRNCCIITSLNGSAKNEYDITIPSDCKFDTKKININKIIKRIDSLIENYSTETLKFMKYRNSISEEKKEFYNQIDFIFGDFIQ